MLLKENRKYMTCVINDPLGHSHISNSSDHYRHLKLFCFVVNFFFKYWGQTEDDTNKNNDHYQPGLWVG